MLLALLGHACAMVLVNNEKDYKVSSIAYPGKTLGLDASGRVVPAESAASPAAVRVGYNSRIGQDAMTINGKPICVAGSDLRVCKAGAKPFSDFRVKEKGDAVRIKGESRLFNGKCVEMRPNSADFVRCRDGHDNQLWKFTELPEPWQDDKKGDERDGEDVNGSAYGLGDRASGQGDSAYGSGGSLYGLGGSAYESGGGAYESGGSISGLAGNTRESGSNARGSDGSASGTGGDSHRSSNTDYGLASNSGEPKGGAYGLNDNSGRRDGGPCGAGPYGGCHGRSGENRGSLERRCAPQGYPLYNNARYPSPACAVPQAGSYTLGFLNDQVPIGALGLVGIMGDAPGYRAAGPPPCCGTKASYGWDVSSNTPVMTGGHFSPPASRISSPCIPAASLNATQCAPV